MSNDLEREVCGGETGPLGPGASRFSDAAAATWVVVLAVVLRSVEAVQQGGLFNDGPRFIEMAEAFARGDWRAALQDAFHPLTALCMAGVSWLTSLSPEASAQLVNVCAGGLGAWAAYAATREAFGSRLALAAGFAFAVHPRLVASSAGVQSDGLHVALFLVAVWAAQRALRVRSAGFGALAGGACALAYLTRPEGLAVAVVFGMWWLVDLLRSRLRPVPAFGILASFAVVLALIGAPYVVAMHEITGAWSITTKKSLDDLLDLSQLRPTVEPGPAVAVLHDAPTLPAVSAVPSNVAPSSSEEAAPLGNLHRLVTALGEIAHDGMRAIKIPALLLIVLGWVAARPSRATWVTLSYLALFLLLLIAVHLHSGYVSRRHWLPVVALVCPYIGRGCLRLLDWIPQLPAIGAWRHARAIAVGAVLIASFAHAAVPQEDAHKVARRKAAVWLDRATDAPCVATHRSRDAYIAGSTCHIVLEPSLGSPILMLEQVRDSGAEYAMVDGDHWDASVPLPSWAREIHRTEHRGESVLVLELERP